MFLRALFVLTATTALAAEPGGLPPCPDVAGVAIVASPQSAAPGRTLRVMAVSDRPLDAVLTIVGGDGSRLAQADQRHGGPPYWWYVEVAPERPGTYRATLATGPDAAACRDVAVGAAPPPAARGGDGVWPVVHPWDDATEALFAAWVEKLFDAPLDQQPSWRSLHEVTRDAARNFLHDHLGLGEDDEHGLRLEPDCADLPYFLRAYFAWKLGLPFGYSECSRGDGGRPPVCTRWHSNVEPPPGGGDGVARLQRFFRWLGDVVQSGAGRTAAQDDRTDLYPVRLGADTLRPGTVYADPYGHTLVLVHRVPQSASTGGLLLAVDAQPDGTVARKRYWRGNFLFSDDPSLGGPAFKHFRPIARRGDAYRPLPNHDVADWSDEQSRLGVEAFYDRIDDVLSPDPLDPARAFRETIDALDEQIRARLRSVANGEEYHAGHPGTIAMPEGAAIFEAEGAWEDFATPSRDLRLLIAIDVVRGFPDKVARRPERFAVPSGQPVASVHGDLDTLLRTEAAARRFEYTRSDGSAWSLTLGDVMSRTEALEMAYDPNDCAEIRWGAPAGSDEMSTCRRHAPAEQLARMAAYRPWFHERRRPAR